MADNGLANAVGNSVYEDLTMTRYPEVIDKRGANIQGGNENLNLHQNLVDYNMAEHVNALADAVMAIQRTLGIAPQISVGTTATGTDLINLMKARTVNARMTDLENKNFDARYGGPHWVAEDGQTLEGHHHTGVLGHPTKIDLVSEVQGLLPRNNIDLRYSEVTGLTGANISINGSKSDSIDKVVADKLSVTEGGVINNNLTTKGTSWNRFERDYDVEKLTGDLESDETASRRAISKTTTTAHTFLSTKFDDLYYGRYVIIIRARTNTLVDSDLIKISTMNAYGVQSESTTFKGTEFKAKDQWQNFYFVMNHDSALTNKTGKFKVEKLPTTASVKVSLDYVLITPVHPAIFDR